MSFLSWLLGKRETTLEEKYSKLLEVEIRVKALELEFASLDNWLKQRMKGKLKKEVKGEESKDLFMGMCLPEDEHNFSH